jgi:hypothetical protein
VSTRTSNPISVNINLNVSVNGTPFEELFTQLGAIIVDAITPAIESLTSVVSQLETDVAGVVKEIADLRASINSGDLTADQEATAASRLNDLAGRLSTVKTQVESALAIATPPPADVPPAP